MYGRRTKTASALGIIEDILMGLPDNIVDDNEVENLFESLSRNNQDDAYRRLEAAQQVLSKAQTNFVDTLKDIRRDLLDAVNNDEVSVVMLQPAMRGLMLEMKEAGFDNRKRWDDVEEISIALEKTLKKRHYIAKNEAYKRVGPNQGTSSWDLYRLADRMTNEAGNYLQAVVSWQFRDGAYYAEFVLRALQRGPR